MRFFQPEEENKFTFRMVHFAHLVNRKSHLTTRNSKKPYQRYKDMKLAIKLIQKQDRRPTQQGNSTSKTTPSSLQTTPSSSIYAPAPTSSKGFRNKRMLVMHKKNPSLMYRQMLVKTVSLNQLMLAR